jgi:hypothetical protein
MNTDRLVGDSHTAIHTTTARRSIHVQPEDLTRIRRTNEHPAVADPAGSKSRLAAAAGRQM